VWVCASCSHAWLGSGSWGPLDSFIDVLNRNQGATEFFLGVATGLLTLALVAVAFRSLSGTAHALAETREANKQAKRANEIAEEGLRLERQRTRGANIVLKLDEGTRFHAWARGPSSGNDLGVALEVGGAICGDEQVVGLVDSATANAGPVTFHFQRFVSAADGKLKADALDGATGRLVGECMNDDLAPEIVSSFLVRINCPNEAGAVISYERLSTSLGQRGGRARRACPRGSAGRGRPALGPGGAGGGCRARGAPARGLSGGSGARSRP
jgi:hypothetical protein